jgi:DnaJ-class molecular chaperone
MDHYKTLGISKDATDDQIKQAYRKLAREHHPDKGGNKEEFQKIQQAYDILGDKQKRANYDNPTQPNQFPFNFSFSQPSQTPSKLSNVVHTCNITLDEIFTGTTKRFSVSRDRACFNCNKACNLCHGSGVQTQHIQLGPFTQVISHPCGECGGIGMKAGQGCSKCDSGKITEKQIVETQIERGTESGHQFVIEEWGKQPLKPDQIPGDLVIVINVQQHQNFIRNGLDLYTTINITLLESIYGKDILVNLFNAPFSFNCNQFGEIIDPRKKYIIKGRGLSNNINTGDLHVTFDIDYNLSDEKQKTIQSLLFAVQKSET